MQTFTEMGQSVYNRQLLSKLNQKALKIEYKYLSKMKYNVFISIQCYDLVTVPCYLQMYLRVIIGQQFH